MKDKSILIRVIELIMILLLYYIVGYKKIFLYAISLSLYNIFRLCFNHVSISSSLQRINNSHSRFKLLNITLFSVALISIFFIFLSITISDTMTSLLNLPNLFLIYLFMGLSLISEPIIYILSEYLEITKNKKISKLVINSYYGIEYLLTILISLIVFRLFNVPNNIAVSLLYLSKIISLLVVGGLSYFIIYISHKQKKSKEINLNYRNYLKEIFASNLHSTFKKIIRESYPYISIIILYLILNSRYGYSKEIIWEDITFIYFLGLSLINFISDSLVLLVNKLSKKNDILYKIISIIKVTLPLSLVFSIVSPLVCHLLYNDPDKSIYLTMLNFTMIFLSIYNISYATMKNIKITNISLLAGLFTKLILIVPLINGFYRVGYNLIYGDILSTIISYFVSTIINYLNLRSEKENKYLNKILKILYENIVLCIILVVIEFIIPIKTDSYLKSFGLLLIYLLASITYINEKNKKRG